MRRKILGALTALVSTSALLMVVTPVVHADADDDPLCYTTRSERDSDAYGGPAIYKGGEQLGESASAVYDWTDYTAIDPTTQRFTKDVRVPETLYDWGYVPQGLAAITDWAGTDEDIL